MFFVVHKNSAVLVSVIALVCIITAAIRLGHGSDESKPAFSVPTSNKVVVIDAGHGGIDNGASANGVIEKEINLIIALKLQELIEQGGGIAILTRDEDESTQDDNREKGVAQKKSDLSERVKLMNTSNADIFVSIHMNKFPEQQYRGAQVFYANNSEDSKHLGEALQKSLIQNINDGNKRAAKPVANDSVFVLKNASVPAALVECGFLSNPSEAALLRDEVYQRKLAWAIYMGIVAYFVK